MEMGPSPNESPFHGGVKLYMYVLLKALPPVCMKYTARDNSQMANIARGKADRVLYLS